MRNAYEFSPCKYTFFYLDSQRISNVFLLKCNCILCSFFCLICFVVRGKCNVLNINMKKLLYGLVCDY